MDQSNIRKPCAAGKFYPASAKDINKMISSFADGGGQKKDVIGCVLPHAGYVYSGRVAAQTISKVNIKDTIVLLGPNHTGIGASFSIMPRGFWETPLGNVEIDERLAGLLLSKTRHLEADMLAHRDEHSLEVELPILQYFRSDFKIIPIAMMSNDLSALKEVGEELAAAISENNLKDSVMLIASSDLTHYEEQRSAQKKDSLAIEAISNLDENKLEQAVRQFDISMCGFGPVAVLIKAAKLLGAKKGELIKYQTSGDATGDSSSVVGYAGITIY
jgi:MEMO1 family protein